MRRRFLAAVAAGLVANASAPAQAPGAASGSYMFTPPARGAAVTPAAATTAAPAAQSVPGSYVFTPPPAGPHPAPAGASAALLADCGPEASGRPTIWATGEYLVWFTRSQSSPTLVASVPDQFVQLGAQLPDGTPITNLFPGGNGRRIEFDAQSGVAARVGANWGPTLGFDVGGFFLESQSEGGTFVSAGSPSLARMYVRALTGIDQFLYSALPGEYPGSVSVFADTQLWGADGNIRVEWYRLLADRNELLGGFRFLSLEEGLIINDRSDLDGGAVINTVQDVFRTRNHFYGGQIGLHTRLINSASGLSLDVIQKLAIGGMSQRVQAFGGNTLTGFPDEPTGLYVQPGNSGVFERGRFAAVSELTINLGYCITPNVRAHVGYNLLWVSSVVRPGQAIDPVINDSTIRFVADPPDDPNSRRPAFDFNRASSDFWAQGLNLGLTILY